MSDTPRSTSGEVGGLSSRRGRVRVPHGVLITEVWPTPARHPPLKREDVGSTPTASTDGDDGDCVRGVAATCHLPTVASRVRTPPDALVQHAPVVSAEACGFATAAARVRTPPGALG